MCAPSSIGRVSIGVAAVESTATTAPTSRAIAHAAAMSVTSHVGLAGVSIQMSRGRRARALGGEIVDRCVVVELDRQSPWRGERQQPFAQRPVHVARSERASPGASAWNTAAAAAWPEPNTIAAAAPSSDASNASA